MIKKILNVILTFAFICIFSQEKISKDETGKFITEAEFQTKWRNDNLNLFRWDYMEKGKRICTLKDGQVSSPELNYESTLKILEKKLDTVFSKNAIVVFNYWYYNDICGIPDDNWPSSKLKEVKERNEKHLKDIRNALRKNNQDLYVFYIFGKNSNVKKKKSDYYKSFMLDSDDFFRESYFKEEAMCGSNLIITPSGNLLYNGESSLGYLLKKYIY